MRGPEDLAALVADLDALPPRRRRAVLAALKPFERARVEALLEAARKPPREEADVSERRLAGLSPWLARQVREARNGGAAAGLTPDTQALLLKAAEAPAPDVGDEAALPAPAPPRRSLAGAVAGLLSPRRGRP